MESLSPPPTIDATLGALFLGNNMAAIFYGVTTVQSFTFYKRSRTDSAPLKYLIFLLWLFDTLHLAFIIHNLYYYAIVHYDRLPSILLVPVWSLMAMMYATCISDLIVRGIFAHRIWRLSGKKNIYIAILVVPSIMTSAAGMTCASKMFSAASFLDFPEISTSLYIGLASGVAADFLITASLVWLLYPAHTGFKRTDSLINTLMVYAINTGLFAVLCRTMCLITFAIWPREMVFIAIYFVLSELSFNALLGTLNARKSLRQRANSVYTKPFELSIRSSQNDQNDVGKTKAKGLIVQIDEQTISSPKHDARIEPSELARTDAM